MSDKTAEVLATLHETVIMEWEEPEEFRLMLNVAASDAGISDETLGKVGERLEESGVLDYE